MKFTEIRFLVFILLFSFLVFFSLRKNQNKSQNWAVFYSCFYISIFLPIVNKFCIKLGLWSFVETAYNVIGMPIDLYFSWIILWGVFPSYFLEKKYLPIILILCFWIDFVLMPLLAVYKVINLNTNWLIGEIILIIIVLFPALIWSYSSYKKKFLELRALFQILVITALIIYYLPYLLFKYNLILSLNFSFNSYLIQLFFIIALPGLIAVQDLVQKGKGTPFPYDPTEYLVQNGVYAYIRNPIQWTLSIIFFLLAFQFKSYYLLFGFPIAILYSIGISDYQENIDLLEKFGNKWNEYKSNTPKWYFLWKPKNYPIGTVYFDYDCNQCSQIKKWFEKRETNNLIYKNSSQYNGNKLTKLTYVDYLGNEYKSILAISHAFEHINLMYASIGWFIRFPGISFILQAIINSMNLGLR